MRRKRKRDRNDTPASDKESPAVIRPLSVQILSPKERTDLHKAIRTALHAGFPRAGHEEVDAVMGQVQTGLCQTWIVFETERLRIHGMFITRILQDLQGRRLYLNSLVSGGKLNGEEWKNCLKKVEEFARQNHCQSVDADSNVKYVIDLAKRLGFVVDSVNLRKRLDAAPVQLPGPGAN